jgi:hypothetical protein
MKSSALTLCTLVAMLLLCSPLTAQDTLRYRLGAGISVEPALFGQTLDYYPTGSGSGYFITTPVFSVSPYYIYIPVTLTRKFRLEPRFGIYSFSTETSNSINPSQPSKNDIRLTNIGLSAEYVIPAGEKFQFYVGPRASLNLITYTYTNYYYYETIAYNGGAVTVNDSETDFMISGIFGAEYFPLAELSIGGEVDLNYVSFGNPDISQSPPQPGTQPTTTRTQTLVSTGALLFIRWYFL